MSRIRLKSWNAMLCMLTVDREILEHLLSEERLVHLSLIQSMLLYYLFYYLFIQAMQLFLKQKGSHKLLGRSKPAWYYRYYATCVTKLKLFTVRVNLYGVVKPELDIFEVFGISCVKLSYFFVMWCWRSYPQVRVEESENRLARRKKAENFFCNKENNVK